MDTHNTNKDVMRTSWLHGLLVAAMMLTGAMVATACGDDDGGDIVGDAGSGGSSTAGDGGSGGSGTAGEGGSGGGGDAGSGGSSTAGDGGSGGGGACESTESECDTCVTWEENVYNACSDQTTGCIPFDNAGRVPGWPDYPRP